MPHFWKSHVAAHFLAVPLLDRVKSGNFGHQVNSDIHLQTVKNPDETVLNEPSHQDVHCVLI